MFKYFFSLLVLLYSFECLSLNVDQTIKSTVKNNLKVKLGLEKLSESKELIDKSIGEKRPTVTGTVSGIYSNSESKTSSKTTTPETFTDKYKISVSQNIYDAGINDLEIERSKILYNDEVLKFQIMLQNLILDAITGYLTVINYEKSLATTKKNFDSVSKALEETKILYNNGSSTLYDLLNAESYYAIANTNLFSAIQNLEISKKSFENIVGLKPIDLEDIINIDISIKLNNLINNTEDNLNLKLINNELQNNQIILLKEKKSKHASLDITGSAEYSDSGRVDEGTETTNGSISLTLTVPIYKKGIDDSNIRKYQSKVLQSEINYEDFQNDLIIQINNEYKNFKINEVKMNSNMSIIKATETSLQSLEEEYNIGTKTIIDVIEEEGKLLTAQVDYFNSKKDYLVNYFKIKSLDGSLLNLFKNYLPTTN